MIDWSSQLAAGQPLISATSSQRHTSRRAQRVSTLCDFHCDCGRWLVAAGAAWLPATQLACQSAPTPRADWRRPLARRLGANSSRHYDNLSLASLVSGAQLDCSTGVYMDPSKCIHLYTSRQHINY